MAYETINNLGGISGLTGTTGQSLWDQWRQANVNDYNTSLANNPSLQAAGVQSLSFTPSTGFNSNGGLGASTTSAPAPSSGGFDFTSNPYAGQIGSAITNRVMNDYLTPALNQINSGAVATGGMGGSRQGVAQGQAIAHGMDYLSGNLANAYSGLWNEDQNRALSQYGMDQNFYTAQRGQDLNQLMAGGNLYGLGQSGSWGNLQNYGNLLGQFTGYGNTTGTSSQGGGAMGATGGALGTYQLGHLAGWW